ncbi:MAG: SpaH/EbpB family LPXTG-anchored major pilin, partial [Clostridium sp.]
GPITTNGSIQTTEIINLDLGYYIIIDQGGGQVIAAAGMGNTNPNLEIHLKASKPTVDKEIQNNDDNNWGVVGDNQIGDDVNYRLKATLPSNITGYTSYTYTLHDTLDKGLSFNNDVEVYVGEKKADGSNKLEVGTDYTVEMANHGHNGQTDGATLFDVSVNVMDGIQNKRFNLGDTLYIYYSAKLNENAVVAGDSNDNNLYLEYSNNPYDENSKEEGPDNIVKDYTFKINALKTNEDGNPLKGAEFNIIKDGNPVKFKVNTLADGTNEYIVSTDDTATETIVSGENGKFNIIGLDDNVEYTLKETKAPEGYNSIRDIKFIITASYDEQGNIISITTNADSIQVVDGTFELGTTIVNKKATLLPETGGMGTVLYSLVGGILMVSALGLFILNRKKKVS